MILIPARQGLWWFDITVDDNTKCPSEYVGSVTLDLKTWAIGITFNHIYKGVAFYIGPIEVAFSWRNWAKKERD